MRKIIFSLLGVVLLFAFALKTATWIMPYFAPSRYGEGSLLFTDIDRLSSIVIKKGNEKIKLRKQEGSWICNGYYAKNAVIDAFLQELGQAEIKAVIDKRLEAESDIELKDGQNAFFYFGLNSTEDGKSVVVADNKSYVLDRNIALPSDVREFFVQPLLPLSNMDIEQYVGIEAQIDDLVGIEYTGAVKQIPSSMVNHDYKSFVLISNDGVKFVCGLYKYGENYLMTLSLKTTIMPTVEADAFVKQNGFRYEGWYFKILPSDGNRLWKKLTKD